MGRTSKWTAAFKAKVAVEALKEQQSVSELAKRFDASPAKVTDGFIVGWRLSNTLSADNCYWLIEDCIRLYGAPEIVNSDQGSQYTTQRWEELLMEHDIKVSMDGRGWCKDNIWIECFWRTIKLEYVYLNPVDTVDELRRGLGNFTNTTTIGAPTKACRCCFRP